VELDTKITDELKQEGIARELIRHIQSARKNAGFNVDDRISLGLETDSEEVKQAYAQFKDEIFKETLTTAELEGEAGYTEDIKIENSQVKVSIKK